MIRSLIAIFSVLALLLTLGCGQKGPLSLPPVEPDTVDGSAAPDPADPQPETDTERPE
jgi:predicted small lipoprotein YifL